MAFHTRKSYSVSRNAYGIRIHLLDGTEVDFTLSPASTGQDCLDRVAQVLDLDEVTWVRVRIRIRLMSASFSLSRP